MPFKPKKSKIKKESSAGDAISEEMDRFDCTTNEQNSQKETKSPDPEVDINEYGEIQLRIPFELPPKMPSEDLKKLKEYLMSLKEGQVGAVIRDKIIENMERRGGIYISKFRSEDLIGTKVLKQNGHSSTLRRESLKTVLSRMNKRGLFIEVSNPTRQEQRVFKLDPKLWL